MPFILKAYRNYDWEPLPDETFRHYRAARARAAALLQARPPVTEMIAVCVPAPGAGKGRVVACLTACASRGARATEWPGVWEWGPPVGAVEEVADVGASHR